MALTRANLLYYGHTSEEQSEVVELLCGRVSWAASLLQAIDLDGASFIGKVPARVAVSNLKRLERGLRGKSISSKSNRICFFRHYCYESGFHPSELKKSE